MQRCFQLARMGAGLVAPNPMVGAVLVYENRIIGEGFHEYFGGPHAEVNCLNSVRENEKELIKQSRLYVSLEPCSHFGKTPPCTNLILENNIPEVVIGCADTFEKVNGHGIEILQAAGVKLITGILNIEARALNKRFFTFHEKQRPYIILKWAQSNNRKIAGENFKPVKITNDITNRLVHKWRSEEAAISIGTNTALMDNPSLTNRFWTGKNPVRVVIDSNLTLPASLNLFDVSAETIVINRVEDAISANVIFYKCAAEKSILEGLLDVLALRNLTSVLVEGGSALINSFIEKDLWDEARTITNRDMEIENGLNAPELKRLSLVRKESFGSDEVMYYQ